MREVYCYRPAACRTLHTLRYRIGSEEYIWHHAAGLQPQESRSFRKRPCIIHGVVVPLPVQSQFGVIETVSLHDGGLRLVALQRPHGLRHLSVLIAYHRPSVNPPARRESEHSPYPTAILEDDAVPVTVLCIDDSALSNVWEPSKIALQNNVLLVWSVDVVGAVAHLTAVASWSVYLRYHQEVVFASVLDYTAALKKPCLVLLTLEYLLVCPLDYIREVWFQLHQLSCAIDDIHPAVVIEEERAVVEVAHTRDEVPWSFCLFSREDICVAHRTLLVGSQQSIEAPIVIFQ